MINFDANITFMFREYPLLERFSAARRAGFSAVEILSPEGLDPMQLAEVAQINGIDVVLCNAPMGDFVEGGLGLSAVPGLESKFQNAIKMAGQMASLLKCKCVHVGPSRVAKGDEPDEYIKTLVGNLKVASDILGTLGISVLVEPLNTNDMPGVVLSRVEETLAVIDRTDCTNIQLQFDIYHMSQMENEPIAMMEKYIERIGHIQFADSPGRGEPGTGDVPFDLYFSKLEALGYDQWVGAEYIPKTKTGETLEWLAQYRLGKY